MQAAITPRRINRFEIERTLGSGAQGTVHLARDPKLNRKVAIKTPIVGGRPDEHRKRVDTLLAEARMVSQLSHPNVVPLFDAGEESDLPFLVFEYVEGTVLSHMIKRERRLSPSRAVGVAVDLLAALGYAHGKGVMHRDIKPGNIMLTADGSARVMDFGIAQHISDSAPDAPDGLRGTPCYLAPEYVNSGQYTPKCDIYSAGVVLYEMLTGQPAVEGRNVFEILHRAANEPIVPPSRLNPEVDEKLDDLVFKALSAEPGERFESAQAMHDALRAYLDPVASNDGSTGADAGGTLEFLLRRMRHKSDFPALSNTISTINRVTGSQDENASALSNTILKDFALTNKLLRLVNTAYFGQYGGTISTVSRAVVILGFDRIRSVAMSLMLLEHLQNKAQAAQLKEDVVASYFSGLLARELVAKANIRDGEEAFICTMFHDLGRLMARFYLADEAQQIDRLVEQGSAEKQAALKVLGISYEELGIGTAKAWNFPDRMVQSMRRLPDEQVRRPATAEDRLRAIAELGTELCASLREPDAKARDERMQNLVEKFGKGLNVTPQVLQTAVQQSMQDLKRDAGALDLRAADGFLARVALAVKPDERVPGTAPGATPADHLQTAIEHATLSTPVPAVPADMPQESSRKALLTAGIQDITNALVGDYKLNDILRIILEAMYRGMGFTRVLLCVREPSTNTLRGRFGFGSGVDEIIRKGFGIPIGGSRDVFQAAITNGADILIDDTDAESIRPHVPDWYRKAIPAKSFALFPIIINKKPIGLLYGDADAAGRLKIHADELALLKTLRNQAVLAIRQHTP